jgi:hypothetical protein
MISSEPEVWLFDHTCESQSACQGHLQRHENPEGTDPNMFEYQVFFEVGSNC